MTSLAGNMGRQNSVAGYDIARLNKFTPEQQQLFSHLYSYAQPNSYLSRLAAGDEELLSQVEQPALRQFGKLQGNISSRFSGLGSFGSRRSSGFQNSINSAAQDFALQLQAQRQNLQRQALQDLRGLSQELLSYEPEEQFLTNPRSRNSALRSAIGTGAPLAGAAIGGYFGGLPGAELGGSIGNKFADAFA